MNLPRPLRLAPFAMLLLAGAATANPAESPLAGTSKAWEDAVAKGDAVAVGALYAEDAELLPPNTPRIDGRKGIVDMIAGMIAQGVKIKLAVRSEKIDGALGFKSGDYTLVDKDGKTVEQGKWVEVWERREGKWWLIRDIWNSDAPAPAPAPEAKPPGGASDN